ncbi:hypothetical protein H072_10502 [Dactylellina haptotyla CBS 200.50]|uniref:Large ribosomal subunit protein uL23m n=1 Tax=Dactylellina haptotyla (strain CBS 200.50) TaxID=1284197 RepID=S8A4L9_DACHA|nr:hypothetical protein H072_10502 [Dactylellina haptotyla CBS 200.50]
MKNIYLPNFVIALIRTPKLPPNYAQFSVPLSFNKLDLKNYLKNLYGINALGIRSSIRQQAVELTYNNKTRSYARRRSEKRMTVELAEPFIWPEEPKDLSKFDNKLYTNIEKYKEAIREETSDQGRGRWHNKSIRGKLAEAVKEQQAQKAGGSAAAKEELTEVDFDAATRDKP